MKTIKIVLAILLIGTGSVLAQKTKTVTKETAKENSYFVQVPHTHEQCLNMLNDMKGKGDAYLSKFWFGCMSGDHTAYGVLKGTSEEDVRKMLPKDEQANARIEKVDKFSIAQLDKMHHDKK
jgi:hypothetical protein